MIEKRFLRYEQKSAFNYDYRNNLISNESIAFIEDTMEIWTWGKFYKGFTGYDVTKILSLINADNLSLQLYNKEELKEPIEENWNINSNDTIQDAIYKIDTRLNSEVKYLSGRLVNPDNDDLELFDTDKLRFKNSLPNMSINKYGHVIIRPSSSLTNAILTLSQNMFTTTNTIYEIKYAFTLEGKSITMPTGSSLFFNGGSIQNGTINGNGMSYIYGYANSLQLGICGGLTVNKFYNIDGTKFNSLHIGGLSQRPTNEMNGFIFFDTTINKLIIWNSTRNKWIDIYGNDVNISHEGVDLKTIKSQVNPSFLYKDTSDFWKTQTPNEKSRWLIRNEEGEWDVLANTDVVTLTLDGLMSKEDKLWLDGDEETSGAKERLDNVELQIAALREDFITTDTFLNNPTFADLLNHWQTSEIKDETIEGSLEVDTEQMKNKKYVELVNGLKINLDNTTSVTLPDLFIDSEYDEHNKKYSKVELIIPNEIIEEIDFNDTNFICVLSTDETNNLFADIINFERYEIISCYIKTANELVYDGEIYVNLVFTKLYLTVDFINLADKYHKPIELKGFNLLNKLIYEDVDLVKISSLDKRIDGIEITNKNIIDKINFNIHYQVVRLSTAETVSIFKNRFKYAATLLNSVITINYEFNESTQEYYPIFKIKVNVITNGKRFFTFGHKTHMMNGHLYGSFIQCDKQSLDSILSDHHGSSYAIVKDQRSSVCIDNNFIRQLEYSYVFPPLMEQNIAGIYIPISCNLEFYYKVEKPGVLSIEFEHEEERLDSNTIYQEYKRLLYKEPINFDESWHKFSINFDWNGHGDFKIKYTGKMYIHSIMIAQSQALLLKLNYAYLNEYINGVTSCFDAIDNSYDIEDFEIEDELPKNKSVDKIIYCKDLQVFVGYYLDENDNAHYTRKWDSVDLYNLRIFGQADVLHKDKLFLYNGDIYTYSEIEENLVKANVNDHFVNVDEKGFYIVDQFGNIGFSVTNEGINYKDEIIKNLQDQISDLKSELAAIKEYINMK